MVADRRRELLLPITILVSVAVGVVIGGVFGRAENTGHTQSNSPASDSKAIIESIDAVRAELVRVRERLDASSMSVARPDHTETRSSVAPDATTEIHKATEALVQAAESLRAASTGAAGGAPPLVVPRTIDPAVWSELGRHEYAENTKTYMLWNYQQVLDRFGPPDMFGMDTSGTYWVYQHEQPPSATFRFTDGLVASVQMSE